MKKTLYALQGTADLGKTETLNILIDLLASVAYTYTIEKYNEYTNDRKAVFTIGDNKICVYTAGDNEEEAKNAVSFFKKNKAQLAFTAYHNTSSTSRAVLKDFSSENGYEFVTEQKQDDEKESRQIAMKLFIQILQNCN